MTYSFSRPRPSPMSRWNAWLWARVVLVLTVVLHTAAFPPFDTPEAAWVFAVPALLWVIVQRPRRGEFLFIISGAMFVSWLILLEWLRHVTVGGMIGMAAVMTVFPVLWFAAAHWALPRVSDADVRRRILVTLGLAALWVLLEWVRSWIFTGFPWLPLAASQWQRPAMLQAAAYGGAWVVSFALIIFSLGLAAYLRRLHAWVRERKGRFCPEFYLAMITLLVVVSFGPFGDAAHQVRRPLLKAGLVQPDIPQNAKWDPAKGPEILNVLERQTRAVALHEPDVIFWPEAVMPSPVVGDPEMLRWVRDLTDEIKIPLVFGAVALEEVPAAAEGGVIEDVWRNGVYVTIPRDGLQRFSYAKRHLVPFGEYVPFRRYFPNAAKFVPIGGDFTAGERAGSVLVPVATSGEILRIAPLICYEDVFGYLARDSVRAGADLLFVATNDAWYGEKGAAYQHAAHSALRAVETRRPVLRAGNAGWSGWFDEYGRTRAVMRNETGSIYYRGNAAFSVDRDVRWTNRQSVFVQWGDWFVWFCAALVLIGGLSLRGMVVAPLKFEPMPAPDEAEGPAPRG